MDNFTIYMLVLIVALLFSLPKLFFNAKSNVFWYLIPSMILLLFSLSIHKFSGDYIPYLSYINSISVDNSFTKQFTLYDYELGFSFICWGLKFIFKESETVYLLLIIIPSILLLISFYLKSKVPLLSLAIYIAHFHWWMGLVLVRQLYALLFVLLAIWVLFNKRSIYYYLLFILCATLFHNSALILIFLPIYLYLNFNVRNQILLIVLFFMIGQLGVLNFAFEMVFSNISRGSVYSEYLDVERGMNYLAYIEKILVFLFLLKFGNRLSEINYKNSIQFYSFALIVCGLLFKSEVVSRLLSYFDIYIYLYILPFVLYKLNKRQKIISVIFIFPYLLFYLYRFISITISF